MNERASSKYATFGLFLAIFFLFRRCKGNNLFRDYETFCCFFDYSSIKMHNNIPFLTQKLAFMRVAPVLTMWYRLSARQIGKAMPTVASKISQLSRQKSANCRVKIQPTVASKYGQLSCQNTANWHIYCKKLVQDESHGLSLEL